MYLPKIYIDTTVLKFSATRLPRLRPRKQVINWGGKEFETTVHDYIRVNPNDSIGNNKLKSEVELLPTLAEAGKRGEVQYVLQMETLFESWGIPKMDSETGTFYDAPYEHAEAPIKYSRVLIGFGLDARNMQFNFLSSIKKKRFLELQKMTGAYQGAEKLRRNQLLDAFHIWCAEHNKCDYFLTLDFKLVNVIRRQKRAPLSEVVTPSELMNKLGIST
ncbi:MAG: hypothetical protein Q8M92_03235 [Candidatus Subteraquimicrobiales bacterium]|nr:hypothetical protein [Candidatus Subteraquimicrobiales bacterium]